MVDAAVTGIEDLSLAEALRALAARVLARRGRVIKGHRLDLQLRQFVHIDKDRCDPSD